MRRSALNCFADPMAVIDGLRRVPLVSSRQHGTFSLRDIEIATGQTAAEATGDARPDEERINAAFAAMPIEELDRLARQRRPAPRPRCKAIDATMRDAAGSDATPSFDALVGAARQNRAGAARAARRCVRGLGARRRAGDR